MLPWGRVPPPDSPPGVTIAALVTDSVALRATAFFSQDFMPNVGGDGSPLYVGLQVIIANTGSLALANFSVPKTTIYFGGTRIPVVTFALVLSNPDEFLVGPGATVVFNLSNDWTSLFYPNFAEGTPLYARVLVVWMNGTSTILTSPESDLMYTY